MPLKLFQIRLIHKLPCCAVIVFQGKYEEAERQSRRALAIDEKVCGLDHPKVAADLGNLAQLLKAQVRAFRDFAGSFLWCPVGDDIVETQLVRFVRILEEFLVWKMAQQ